MAIIMVQATICKGLWICEIGLVSFDIYYYPMPTLRNPDLTSLWPRRFTLQPKLVDSADRHIYVQYTVNVTRASGAAP